MGTQVKTKKTSTPPAVRKYFADLGRRGAAARIAAAQGRKPKKAKNPDVAATKSVKEMLAAFGEKGGYQRAENMTPAERKRASRKATKARLSKTSR